MTDVKAIEIDNCAVCMAVPGCIADAHLPDCPESPTVPREPGCQCDKEVGDSPCRVHGEETP